METKIEIKYSRVNNPEFRRTLTKEFNSEVKLMDWLRNIIPYFKVLDVKPSSYRQLVFESVYRIKKNRGGLL